MHLTQASNAPGSLSWARLLCNGQQLHKDGLLAGQSRWQQGHDASPDQQLKRLLWYDQVTCSQDGAAF